MDVEFVVAYPTSVAETVDFCEAIPRMRWLVTVLREVMDRFKVEE